VREELEELIQTARIDHRALDSGLIGAHTPPYKLVKFYSVVSPWCDRNAELYELERNLARIDYGQFDKARKALKALAAQDERDIYGVNRTYSGERPTAENIFLGERVCLSTETVSYWERIRGNLGGKPALIMQPDSPATISEVIDNQALELLTSGLNRWKPLFQALIDA
jgi:hypothetical protein